MLQALGRVAREARRSKGLTQLDIATSAGTNNATISRFESGEKWPLNPDRIVGAYARECGQDEDFFWREALENR